MTENRLRISPVGVRGIAGTGLTAQHVLDFACAFGTFLESAGPVVIGRDGRQSSIMIREGVIAGLLACGREVVDLGVVSTPVIQHAIRRSGAAGGVSIGASHNSADWNALKFFAREGTYLSTAEANELLDIYHLRRFDLVGADSIEKCREEAGALDDYLAELERVFPFDQLRGFRVVADCCNGTSAPILRRIRERFGLDLILINEKTEGIRFAHEPSTNREMVGLQLAPLMVPLKADAGFLFDVDSDRVALADERGNAISEELVLPLLADYRLPRGTGKTVITNLSTTVLLEDIAARHGGVVERVPVGRQAAMDAIASHEPGEIALAGEGTGAIMMPEFRFVYDGIATMLSVLCLLRDSGQALSSLIAGYPRYSILKGSVPLETKRIPELLQSLRAEYRGSANIADGLRVEWPGSWFHVRVSQTEPVVRVICEAKGEPPTELFYALLDTVRAFA